MKELKIQIQHLPIMERIVLILLLIQYKVY